MADDHSLDGCTKTKSVLGEITNLPTKMGLSERENRGVKRSKFNENEICKQIRVTPSQCTDANHLNKNLLKPSKENRDAQVLGFSNAGHGLMGGNAARESSKVCDGNTFTGMLDIGRKAAESDVLNMDGYEVCSQDFERETAEISSATENDGFKKLDLMKGNYVSTVAEVWSKEKTCWSSIDPAKAVDALVPVNVEASDKLGNSCPVPADTSRTASEAVGDGFYGSKDLDAYESKDIDMDYHNERDDHGADNFVLSQSGSADCVFLPESQESRVFGVQRCTELKNGNKCADGIDSMKACSCSFCTKAAYIWLDVNYQDIKARVSAMKKSQKEASALAERTTRHKTIDKHVAKSFTGTVSNLECDLMHQWRFLFQRVGDLLKEESNHLEARLQPLTDLREKYKAELKGTDAELTGKR